jgi:hypothetical protein
MFDPTSFDANVPCDWLTVRLSPLPTPEIMKLLGVNDTEVFPSYVLLAVPVSETVSALGVISPIAPLADVGMM